MELGKVILVLLAGMGIVGLLEHVPGKEPGEPLRAPESEPEPEPAPRAAMKHVRVVKRRQPKPLNRPRRPRPAAPAAGVPPAGDTPNLEERSGAAGPTYVSK